MHMLYGNESLKEGNKRRTSSVAVFSTSCVFVISVLNYKIIIKFKLVSHPLIQANLAISLWLVMWTPKSVCLGGCHRFVTYYYESWLLPRFLVVIHYQVFPHFSIFCFFGNNGRPSSLFHSVFNNWIEKGLKKDDSSRSFVQKIIMIMTLTMTIIIITTMAIIMIIIKIIISSLAIVVFFFSEIVIFVPINWCKPSQKIDDCPRQVVSKALQKCEFLKIQNARLPSVGENQVFGI